MSKLLVIDKCTECKHSSSMLFERGKVCSLRKVNPSKVRTIIQEWCPLPKSEGYLVSDELKGTATKYLEGLIDSGTWHGKWSEPEKKSIINLFWEQFHPITGKDEK